MLKQTIQSDIATSMKAHDELKTSTLRMLLSAVKYFEIAKKGADYEATDEEILSVITKEAKKRKESIEMYKKGGRRELAEKEQKELTILEAFLPKQMEDEELKHIVEEAIKQTGATSMQDMGKLMGVIMPKVKGKAAGSRISAMVKSILH